MPGGRAQNLETVTPYAGAHGGHVLILGRAQIGLRAFL